MGRYKDAKRRALLASLRKKTKLKTRTQASSGSRSGNFAGASSATFLAPLAPDQEEPRPVSAPKRLDPSFIPSPRRREKVRRAAAEPAPKCAGLSSLHPYRSLPGPILKFSLKSVKML